MFRVIIDSDRTVKFKHGNGFTLACEYSRDGVQLLEGEALHVGDKIVLPSLSGLSDYYLPLDVRPFVLEEDGITLTFSPGALDAVAREALQLGTGARGLRGVMEKVMMDIMFQAPAKARRGCRKICITEEDVLSGMRKDLRKAE